MDDLRVRCGVWDIKVKVEKTERHNDMRETERERERETERKAPYAQKEREKKLLINRKTGKTKEKNMYVKK